MSKKDWSNSRSNFYKLYQKAAEKLKRPENEAFQLFLDLTETPAERYFKNPDRKLSRGQQKQLIKGYELYKQGVPTPYITGQAFFNNLEFVITPNVLAPRPETEILLEVVKKLTLEFPNLALLEIGTGPGILAVSLAKELERIILAVDTSKKALKVAKKNVELHKVDNYVTLIKSNLLKNVPEHHKGYLILANLPYLNKKEYLAEPSLKFEPKEALLAKKSGLAAILKLLEQTEKRKDIKILALEHGLNQGQAIRKKASKFWPKCRIDTYLDLADRERVTTIIIDFPK